MGLSVNDRARAVATIRFIEVRRMETAAAWTPTTPEMEVKVMFGRHIWDFAQHADALGKRVFELRQPEHHTLSPEPGYLAMLDSLRAIQGTAERLGALYEAVLPDLARRYREYVAATDTLLDEPTVLILQRILADIERQRANAATTVREIGQALKAPDGFTVAEAAYA
jgi:hypothetical protein